MSESSRTQKMDSIAERKRAIRLSLQKQEVPIEAQFIANPLKDWLLTQSGKWAAFYPFAKEPSLEAVVNAAAHIEWQAPKMDGDIIRFYPADQSQFSHGPFREARESLAEETPLQSMRGMLVPGIAFDKRGGRLGRGRGFYDRILSQWNGIKVGVCWSQFVLEEIPCDEHDVKMDMLATESEIFQFSNREMEGEV